MTANSLTPSILYIGNRLSRHGLTPTSIETLGPLLEARYRVRYASHRKNVAARMADMIWTTFRARSDAGVALIDTYSGRAFHFAVAVGRVARRVGLPYIPILRGGDLPQRYRRSPDLVRTLLDGSYCNVVPSAYLLEATREIGVPVRYIPNSIELRRYDFLARERPRPRLLFVRALHTDYNPEMAIRVLAGLAADREDAELCLVGPDKAGLLDGLQRLAASLGVTKRVAFTGYLTKDEWIARSTRYDIFLNPTNFDNHPVSMIEAMALGLPVVATRVGGVPALVTDGEHGLLVEPGDAEGMTGAVRKLVAQPELAARLTTNARQRVEGYDWEAVKTQWFELIDAALAGRARCDAGQEA